MGRTFDDKPATREQVPLLLGLIGPSGTGKTYSALRLATGIQRVSGGDIYYVDTESRRALHYADQFTFRHLAFGAPFGPLDYLAAIDHCAKKGAKVIIVDSMSHEHEGPGGVLEQHEAECERLQKQWNKSREAVQMSAWAAPKAARRRMINTILQLPCHFVFCFRAKEKLKIIPGKKPEERGVMPIAGEEFVYEMTANMLLLPGGKGGEPTWQSEYDGERMVMKRPRQFADVLTGRQLDESVGEALATWAAGAPPPAAVDVVDLVMRYDACTDPATLRVLEEQRKAAWNKPDAAGKKMLKTAADGARARIEEATKSDQADPDPPTGELPASDTNGAV